MGPYYLTALVFLLGPIEKVIGNSTHSNRTRKVHTGDLADTPLSVEVETHISALLTHKSGAQSTIMVSFEIWGSKLPTIEVYGTSGTIHVPDPNKFNDIPEIYTQDNRKWRAVEECAGFKNSGRGFGLSEMATAIAENRPHRASGELGFHVLEVMEAILKSATSECRATIQSTVKDIPVINLT
jgi:predicted dehydrogenase